MEVSGVLVNNYTAMSLLYDVAIVMIDGLSMSFPWQTPWSTGTECVAKYNFQTTNEQDLPFCKGDVLTIIGVTRVSKAYSLEECCKVSY